MAASCVACSAFTSRPTDMPEGPMCLYCARFMQRMAQADAPPDLLDLPALSERMADALLADLVSAA